MRFLMVTGCFPLPAARGCALLSQVTSQPFRSLCGSGGRCRVVESYSDQQLFGASGAACFRSNGECDFAKFCQTWYVLRMSTMNISLPDSLKDFVDEQVNQGGYGTSSEYVRELIRKDQDRLRLRGLLLAGAKSAQTKPVTDAYFDSLRRKAKRGAAR
jgi:antitoxin ParD1/3/4